MESKTTSLPTDVESFLMDMIQMVELKDVSIDFSDIHKFAETATTNDIKSLREKMVELVDLDLDFEDPKVVVILTNILNTVKGVSAC